MLKTSIIDMSLKITKIIKIIAIPPRHQWVNTILAILIDVNESAVKIICIVIVFIFYQWLGAKVWYLQCQHTGVTAVLHEAIDMVIVLSNPWRMCLQLTLVSVHNCLLSRTRDQPWSVLRTGWLQRSSHGEGLELCTPEIRVHEV